MNLNEENEENEDRQSTDDDVNEIDETLIKIGLANTKISASQDIPLIVENDTMLDTITHFNGYHRRIKGYYRVLEK